MIKWGIIGAGDVAEVKSGPAFNKIDDSHLLIVMRRNADKAADFAKRHNVPQWTNKIEDIIHNDNINAVYIATPPASHKDLAIAALKAGKNVYLEKPMGLNVDECLKIIDAQYQSGMKLSIAHYRRALPAFERVGEIISSGEIGRPLAAQITISQPADSDIIAQSDENWRLNPALSGGGLFHDIAPHQIDLMICYFGAFDEYNGCSADQTGIGVDDRVCGQIKFSNDVLFQGSWAFNCPPQIREEKCLITGTAGTLQFSFYGDEIIVCANEQRKEKFTNPRHIQQAMIDKVCQYFAGKAANPCPAEEALLVTRIMDAFTGAVK